MFMFIYLFVQIFPGQTRNLLYYYCRRGVLDGDTGPLFGEGEHGPHLTQSRLGRGVPPPPPVLSS